VLCACVVALWVVSLAITNVSIVDIFWGPAFAIVAWTAAWQRAPEAFVPAWSLPRCVLLGGITVWALRLGAYLAWRNVGHGEDSRYRTMRARFGPSFRWTSLGIVFVLQGGLIFVISLPVQFVLARDHALAWGGALWIPSIGFAVGLAFETIGDAQLARFKSNPTNRGRVMDRGLWRYTRHPNYFGDFVVWWSVFAWCFVAGAPWWTVASPLVMSTLLLRVSGVALLEETIVDRRPAYRDYIRRTSSFVPWLPKPPA